MADDTPSVASHTTVLSKIIDAIMHLAATSPSGGGPAVAALQAAHREITSWSPPIPQETPEALPPDPAEPITEADGDGPPASSALADEPSLDTPAPQDPTQPPAG